MDKNLDLSNVGIVYNSEIEGQQRFCSPCVLLFFENKLTLSNQMFSICKICLMI